MDLRNVRPACRGWMENERGRDASKRRAQAVEDAKAWLPSATLLECGGLPLNRQRELEPSISCSTLSTCSDAGYLLLCQFSIACC